jgi:hypothetical protein
VIKELTPVTMTKMMLFALFIDFVLDPLFDFSSLFLLAFIPDAIAAFVFKRWLRPYDIELFGNGNSFGSWLTVVIEATPLGLFPIWTFRIALLLLKYR